MKPNLILTLTWTKLVDLNHDVHERNLTLPVTTHFGIT